VICLLVASSTACISSHRFVVVPVPIPVVNVLPVVALVKPLEAVEYVDAPVRSVGPVIVGEPIIVDVAAVVPTI
jgi:hypothetical protein